MQAVIGEQTEDSPKRICTFYILNMIVNVALLVTFMIFAFGSVGDPKQCYIYSEGGVQIAVQYPPEPGAKNEVNYFRICFIGGVVLGVLNIIVYTADAIAKLRHDKKWHGICNGFGSGIFVLTLFHVVWLAVVRLSRTGRIVSGDYFKDDGTRGNEDDYLIAHGRFALVYLILALIAISIACIAICLVGVFMCCMLGTCGKTDEDVKDEKA